MGQFMSCTHDFNVVLRYTVLLVGFPFAQCSDTVGA